MKELIDVVDQEDNVIGVTDVEAAHNEKQFHRVVGIFLFDRQGNICLQDGNKYNKYDLAVGGHVRKGESYDEAAQREMKEELDIEVPITHLSTFLPAKAKKAHFWSIYSGKLPADWVFAPTEEVSSVIFMSPAELLEKFQSSPDLFTHGFANAFAEFLKKRSL